MFVPMHIHSHYSFDSAMNFSSLCNRLKECNYTACTLTDHGTMCGAIEFSTKLNDNNIKPIIGVELYVSLIDATIHEKYNRSNLHMVCLAKNKEGYHDLCRITSEANKPENFYHNPRLDLQKLSALTSNNLIWLTGHPGSILHHAIQSTETEKKEFGIKCLEQMKSKLGDVRVEIQRYCTINQVYGDLLVEIAKETNTPYMACIDAHYASKKDAEDQRLVLASSTGTTLKKWQKTAGGLSSFYNNDWYCIPSYDELKDIHSQEELEGNLQLDKDCKSYSLKEQPSLPRFSCPNNLDEKSYLTQLCKEGLSKLEKKHPIDHDIYERRYLSELEVINEYDLAGYFLIVQDFINWSRSKGALIGPGRGCFLPDTRIKLPDGSYKVISTIKLGDLILDHNGDLQEVYDVLTYDINEDIIELELENDVIIRCTKDHKFLTKNRGWIEAQYLDENDDLVEV